MDADIDFQRWAQLKADIVHWSVSSVDYIIVLDLLEDFEVIARDLQRFVAMSPCACGIGFHDDTNPGCPLGPNPGIESLLIESKESFLSDHETPGQRP